MHSIHALIVDLTLITIYAGITTLIFKKLKQPMVLGYLLAGILAGPYFNLVPTVTDNENLGMWAEIGVIFLLFGLGLEFSFKKMLNVGKAAMITAMINILFMLFLGYNVGLLLGWTVMDSFFLGSMISMSSTTIIIKAFDDLNVKRQKFTDLVFGVLVVEDIVGILMLVLLPTIALGNTINGAELAVSTAKLVFFLVLCFIIGIYIVPTFLKKVEPLINDEMLLVIVIGMCFGMVLLAASSGFSAALGAFLMGSILAETGLIHRIETTIKPLKDFFGAVFFVSVGMMVDPSMFVKYAWPIFLITLVVISGKVFFSCFGFIISGQGLKTSVQGGFSLAQVGEFAFIIASLGLGLGVIDAKVYPIIVAVSVITTFLTPMMIRSSAPVYRMLEKVFPDSWNRYVEQSRKAAPESKIEEQRWKLLFKSYFLRLSLFAMILYTVLGVSVYFLQPWVMRLLPGLPGKLIMTLGTLLLMAPFLKALIGWETILPSFVKGKIASFFCRIVPAKNREDVKKSVIKKLEEKISFCSVMEEVENEKDFFISNNRIAALYYKLWKARRINRLPLIVLTSFRLILVAFFIVTVVHQFLTEDTRVTLLLAVLSIFLLSQSRWLLSQYMKIESQFLENLNGYKHHASEKEEPSAVAEEK